MSNLINETTEEFVGGTPGLYSATLLHVAGTIVMKVEADIADDVFGENVSAQEIVDTDTQYVYYHKGCFATEQISALGNPFWYFMAHNETKKYGDHSFGYGVEHDFETEDAMLRAFVRHTAEVESGIERVIDVPNVDLTNVEGSFRVGAA